MENIVKINRKKINHIKLVCLLVPLFSFSSLTANVIIPEKTEEIQDLVTQSKTIGEIVSYIEKNSNYVFIYEASVDLSKKVEVNVSNKSVDEILKEFFSSNGLFYTIKGRQVIVKSEEGVNNSSIPSVPIIAQDELVVRGIVTDLSGLPLIGVNIMAKGTTIGTVTDANGRFELVKVPKGAILQFSYIGYKNQDATAKERMEIVLTEDQELLEEVVVVGYSTQKKVNLTGSVSTVNFEKVSSRPVTDASQILNSASPGLQIMQSSGEPNVESFSYNIRGVGTLNTSAPLILVDGMEQSISMVNPSDIASVSILKDAASCAIYGNRGANGVIIVTTKNGTDGKISVNYDGTVSYNEPFKTIHTISDYVRYMQLMNESSLNLGNSDIFSQSSIDTWTVDRVGQLPYRSFPP